MTAAVFSLTPPTAPFASAEPRPPGDSPASPGNRLDLGEQKRLIYHQSMTLGRRAFRRGHAEDARKYYSLAMEQAWGFQPREHFPFEELGDVLVEGAQLPEAAHGYMQALEILHAQNDAANQVIIARIERKLGGLPEDARRGARPLAPPPPEIAAEVRSSQPPPTGQEDKTAEGEKGGRDLAAKFRFPRTAAEEEQDKSAEVQKPALGEQRPLPRFQRPARPEPRPGPGAPWIDFSRSELDLFGGAVGFSDSFFADPSYSGGVLFRAPAPIMPVSGVGVFGELILTSMDRNIEPEPASSSGTILFLGVGADYTFLRNEDFMLLGQAGLMYGNFGGITDLDDGISGLVGVAGGINIDKGFWVTYNPQIAVAGSDAFVVFHNFGVLIEF